jgi:hypothetical protein
MATKVRSSSASSSTTAAGDARPQNDTTVSKAGSRIPRIGAAGSQIVFDAAALLDEEVAAGIVAAKKMQKRFQKERRVDPDDFKEVLQRFQGDAHQVVGLLKQQFEELNSHQNSETVARLLGNAHNLIDLVVGMVDIGAEVANELIRSNLPAPAKSGRAKRER